MENANLDFQKPNMPLDTNTPKPNIFSNKKLIMTLGVAVALVIASAVFYFTQVAPASDGKKSFLSPFADLMDNGPAKNVQHPITGIMYTDEEAAPWVALRPLGIMVNNHVDARPQSGLDKADVVYEIVAEAGITRYLAFFLTNTPEKAGPVRSTREYYLVLVKELGDAMIMHIGWSPQALEAIEQWPVRSLGRGGGQFWRDEASMAEVAIEHTAYVNTVDLRKVAETLGWTGTRPFDAWQFKNDKTGYESGQPVNDISINFWYKDDYSAGFKYDPATNGYLRYLSYDEAGNLVPHIDSESGKQLWIKNVVVQFVTESSISGDDKGRLTYELTGSGKALVFIDGKVIESTWSKASRDDRTKFYDLNGQEVKFNRGTFWISVVPDRNLDEVVYTAK